MDILDLQQQHDLPSLSGLVNNHDVATTSDRGFSSLIVTKRVPGPPDRPFPRLIARPARPCLTHNASMAVAAR